MNRLVLVLYILLGLSVAAATGFGVALWNRTPVQHYALGHVVFVDHASPPNHQFTLTARMDVVRRKGLCEVTTKDGTFVIPEANVLFVGPDTGAAAVIGSADPPAMWLDYGPDLVSKYDKAKVEPFPASLFYMGTSGQYAYYYMAQPLLASSRAYKVKVADDPIGHPGDRPSQPLATDPDKWQRIGP